MEEPHRLKQMRPEPELKADPAVRWLRFIPTGHTVPVPGGQEVTVTDTAGLGTSPCKACVFHAAGGGMPGCAYADACMARTRPDGRSVVFRAPKRGGTDNG